MPAGIAPLPPHRSRLLFLALVVASALVPGVVHLRLGAVFDGLVYLTLLVVLNCAQFGAPFLEPSTSGAALLAGVAFALGFPLSILAARSAARLVPAR
jgi:hypothetical protein